MKTVVKNPYHLWAHQAQETARNPTGNRSFKGTDAYSYSTVVARAVKGAKGQRGYLITTRSYSVTTSKHMREIWGAVHNNGTAFSVPKLFIEYSEAHKENVQRYLDSTKKYDADAAKSKLHKDTYKKFALSCIETARAYVEFFGLKGFRLPGPKELQRRRDEITALEAEVQPKREAAKAVRDERRKARWAQENAEYRERKAQRLAQEKLDAEHAEENFHKWINGEPEGKVHRATYPGAYLRLKPGDPETVETSLYAEVPTADVRPVLASVLPVISRGRALELGAPIKLGHYTLKEITADGAVIVGCHRFEKSEVLRFAGVLFGTPAQQ